MYHAILLHKPRQKKKTLKVSGIFEILCVYTKCIYIYQNGNTNLATVLIQRYPERSEKPKASTQQSFMGAPSGSLVRHCKSTQVAPRMVQRKSCTLPGLPSGPCDYKIATGACICYILFIHVYTVKVHSYIDMTQVALRHPGFAWQECLARLPAKIRTNKYPGSA